MGVLEIHVWGARADDVEHPDRIVFDLDPAPETPWSQVVEGARRLRERLSAFDLESFLKATGGKGLHVVVPIRRGPGWDEIKRFSAAVATSVMREVPERYTLQLAKARRQGRLFLDVLRNGRGATWIAPYSTRARLGAPVSAPLAWSELSTRLRSDAFTVGNMGERLRRTDPWRAMHTLRQTLTASMLRDARRSEGGRR